MESLAWAATARSTTPLRCWSPTYIVAIAALAVRINANFLETLRLRFENLDLVQELRIQKEAAEQANVAKSSFLAAASHDLRQPVHALGMFVGALQGHAMNDEMRSLVEHIGSSVSAMDGLFNSLLDISRLDAGIVDTHIEAFPIQPLLARVLERIATCSICPDLIVCDYRLRDGENGIAVVERLRSEYNEDIPAV
jgi:signal transduction histidine kinase